MVGLALRFVIFVSFAPSVVAISICGEGYSIGRPSALITLLRNKVPTRCDYLESLANNGLANLASYKDQQPFIHDVCECRRSIQQRDLILEANIDDKFLPSSSSSQGYSLGQETQKVSYHIDALRSPTPAIIAPSISPLPRNLRPRRLSKTPVANSATIANYPIQYFSLIHCVVLLIFLFLCCSYCFVICCCICLCATAGSVGQSEDDSSLNPQLPKVSKEQEKFPIYGTKTEERNASHTQPTTHTQIEEGKCEN